MARRLVLPVALILVLAVGASARELSSSYVITAAANLPGSNNTDWHTDLTIYNPHSFTLPVRVDYLQTGQDNSYGVPSFTVNVYAYETLNFWDVLGTNYFNRRGTKGALLVYADDPHNQCTGHGCDFVAYARTYTLNPTGGRGEFGQDTAGFPAQFGMDKSVDAYMPQIMVDNDFRTNWGVASWTNGFVTVKFELYDAAGHLLTSWNSTLPPYGHTQQALNTGVSGGTLRAYIAAGPSDAMAYPYASVVNNVTGDGVNIEAHMTIVGVSVQSMGTGAEPLGRKAPRPLPTPIRVEVDRDRASESR